MALHVMDWRLPQRLRRPLKWIGYPLFAIAVFNFSLYTTLPRARIQERVEGAVADFLNADVSSQSFRLTLWSGVGFRADGVTIKSRPSTVAEKPVVYTVDNVTLHPVLADALRGFTSLVFRGNLFGGHVDGGHFRSVPEEGALSFDAKEISLALIPNLGALLSAPGIPITGSLHVDADVRAEKNLISDASGSIKVALENVVIGDGKAKFTVAGNPYLASGLTLPRIKLGTVGGSVSIEKGRATLHDVKAHSADLDLELQGYLELRDPPSLTVLHLYLLIKPSDALLRREASLEALVSMGGGIAKRTDGYYGISVSGPAIAPLALPAKDPPLGLKSTPPSPGRDSGSLSPAPVPSPTSARPSRPPIAMPSPSVPPQFAPPPTELRPPPNEAPPPPPPSLAVPPPSLAVPPPSFGAPLPGTAPPTVGEPPTNLLPPPPRMNSAFRSMGVLPAPSAADPDPAVQ